jgi:ubiquinone/menaquinone biosynthesis C-methylase UbiE
MRRFRAQRLRTVSGLLKLAPEDRVLDVGGSPNFWTNAVVRPRITFLNLYHAAPEGLMRGDEYLAGDARLMPFPSKSFDVAISNSVIEHVGSIDDQRRFADEIRRVSRRYVVQTPDRSFPLEPHFVGIGSHYVPIRYRLRIVRYTTMLGWAWRHRAEDLRRLVEEVRLLSATEVRALFPDAQIVHERFLGLSKSLLAVRRG